MLCNLHLRSGAASVEYDGIIASGWNDFLADVTARVYSRVLISDAGPANLHCNVCCFPSWGDDWEI